MKKDLFVTLDEIEQILASYPTPFYLYDERGIRQNARHFMDAFCWNSEFKEYFAVKATPTPAILRILKHEGLGMDCSSMAELVLAERIGCSGSEIMLTSNNTPISEFQKATDLGATINLDDLGHLALLEQEIGVPTTLSFRYNPGSLKSGNQIIGLPKESKFGMTRDQLFAAYRLAKQKGCKRLGLHTMVASNELGVAYFVETARVLFQTAVDLWRELGIRLSFINLGGGIGIPYHPEERPVDIQQLGRGIQDTYDEIIVGNKLAPIQLMMECGRYMTGPFGYLVARVRHIKESYKTYIGLDANMSDLMRPGMYGAYHHLTVPGKESQTTTFTADVTGSLCENNDKFAINRSLPKVEVGDLVVLHDAGAHGHAMGFNYNGKLRSAELLKESAGTVRCIRRAETLDDYLATIDFDL